MKTNKGKISILDWIILRFFILGLGLWNMCLIFKEALQFKNYRINK
jgi:hypothetical protein